MTALERQRCEMFMKGLFVPFMTLAIVCSLLADTNMLRADRQLSVVYDSGYALADMQKQSPALLELSEQLGEGESERVSRFLLPLLLLLIHAGFLLPTAVWIPVRRYLPTLRKSDAWGLVPFSLAPPALA